MYGAALLPTIDPYSLFSITMTKTWATRGTVAESGAGSDPTMTPVGEGAMAITPALPGGAGDAAAPAGSFGSTPAIRSVAPTSPAARSARIAMAAAPRASARGGTRLAPGRRIARCIDLATVVPRDGSGNQPDGPDAGT